MQTERMPASSARTSDECVKVLSADGTLEHINRTGLELLEAQQQQDLSGHRYPDLWPPEYRDRISTAIRDAADGIPSSFEGRCPTLAGNPRWWETTFYPDTLRGGRCRTVIGVSRDISCHRTEALAAHASTSRVWSLAQTSLEGIVGLSADGRLAFCNPAAAAILDMSVADFVGEHWQSLLHDRRQGELSGRDRPMLSAVGGAAPTLIAEEHFSGRCGRPVPVSCEVYPVSPNARWYGSVVTFRGRPSPLTGAGTDPGDVEMRTLLVGLNRL